MSWTERQAQMLRAMGLRLWLPGSASASSAAATAVVTAVAKEVAPAPAPASASALTPTQHTPATERTAALAPTFLAPAPPVAGLDWAELRQAVTGCRACGLCESRTQTVFGAGHLQAHWLIVGEAPGAQEDAQGEPFVGPSGHLLDAMLQALGLSRQPDGEPQRSVYITNTLKCRPPANRNPQPQEMVQCAPYLQRQIELLQPRIVVAMGRFAAQALLRDDRPLGQLRGQVHRVGGRPLVVTYHPSYLLRSPTEKAKAWADLCLAASTAELAPA